MTDADFESELRPRTSREVAERSLALLAVIDHSYREAATAQDFPRLPALFRTAISPAEAAFLATSEPSEHERAQFSWRAEALVSLLWALGHVASTHPLNQQADLKAIPAIQAALHAPKDFIDSATLRPLSELRQAEEDLYHQHWRVRDAQLFDKLTPEELDPEVVYERRYGLSWVVGWGDEWDDVPTDT